MKRSLRRHHYKRLKLKRKHYWGRTHNNEMSDDQLGLVASTPVICSCPMCGNPRKHFNEKTLKEIINDEENLY